MPVVRVYVPLGRAGLEELAGTGALAAGPGAPRTAYAVTSRLARLAPGLDVAALEYAAFSDAVTAAAALRVTPSDPQAAQTNRSRPKATAGGVDANASKSHLYELAKKLEVPGRSTMTKQQLVQAIEKANNRKTAKARS